MKTLIKEFTVFEYHCEIYEISIQGLDRETWLCGYVYLPETHPYYTFTSENQLTHLDVHGGITFVDGGIIGFDCAHIGDSRESQNELFVTQELENLVGQLDLHK